MAARRPAGPAVRVDPLLLRGYKRSRKSNWEGIEEKAKNNLALQDIILNTIRDFETMSTSAAAAGVDIHETLEAAFHGHQTKVQHMMPKVCQINNARTPGF